MDDLNQAAPAKEDSSSEKQKNPPQVERQDLTTLHERTIAALSYISFLAIVPFYLKKDSAFCRFHGKQGMLLAIMFFIASILSVIDLLFDLMLIVQVSTFFIMGFSALSGRWRKIPIGYDWACQLEEVLTLKTKEEEKEALALKPNQVRTDSEPPEPTND